MPSFSVLDKKYLYYVRNKDFFAWSSKILLCSATTVTGPSEVVREPYVNYSELKNRL